MADPKVPDASSDDASASKAGGSTHPAAPARSNAPEWSPHSAAEPDFEDDLAYLLEKNAELYRRLAGRADTP